MMLSSKNGLWVILMSSLLIVIPMVVFPARLGMNLAAGSFIYSAVEIVYYGVVLFMFQPRTTIIQLLQGAGLTFLYRIILGSVLGIFIALMYDVGLSVAMTLGISRYLPAILLQIAAAPFAIRPIYLAIAGEDIERRKHYIKEYKAPNSPKEEFSEREPRHELRPTLVQQRPMAEPKSDVLLGPDKNGFERAVRYLGEHQAVMVAAVVDREGLSLANFRRGDFDSELWVPLTLLFQDSNEKILARAGEPMQAIRLDVIFGSRKLSVARSSDFNLLVLANHEEDDLLNIRIMQAMDIIKKYTSERYGRLQPLSTEEKYVSNT